MSEEREGEEGERGGGAVWAPHGVVKLVLFSFFFWICICLM
jgi:hypothetical protein